MSGEHCPVCGGSNGFCSRCYYPRAKWTSCRHQCRNARWLPCPTTTHQTSVWTCDCCKAVLAPPRTDRWQSWPWVSFRGPLKTKSEEDQHLCSTCWTHWHDLRNDAEVVLWDRLLMDRGEKNVGLVFNCRNDEDDLPE